MSKFIIKGAYEKNAKDVNLEITNCPNQQKALEIAKEHGIFVEKIEEFLDPQETPIKTIQKEFENYHWNGDMECNDCEYEWSSRRNTPPSQCPNCRSKNLKRIMIKNTDWNFVFICVFILIGLLSFLSIFTHR